MFSVHINREHEPPAPAADQESSVDLLASWSPTRHKLRPRISLLDWADCRLKNPWLQGYKIVEWERWWKGDMWGGKGCRKGWLLHPQVGNHSSFGDCRNLNGAISNIGHFLFPPFPLKAQGGKRGATGRWLSKGTYQKSISQVLLTFCNPCWNVAGDTRPQFVSCISL